MKEAISKCFQITALFPCLCQYTVFLSSQAEAEKQDEALAEQEKEASKQLAEFLEPKAEYYDEDQVETEI